MFKALKLIPQKTLGAESLSHDNQCKPHKFVELSPHHKEFNLFSISLISYHGRRKTLIT